MNANTNTALLAAKNHCETSKTELEKYQLQINPIIVQIPEIQ